MRKSNGCQRQRFGFDFDSSKTVNRSTLTDRHEGRIRKRRHAIRSSPNANDEIFARDRFDAIERHRCAGTNICAGKQTGYEWDVDSESDLARIASINERRNVSRYKLCDPEPTRRLFRIFRTTEPIHRNVF